MNQLNRFGEVNFTCDKCRKKFQQETAYSAARNWDEFEINYTYCENCVKEEKFCSFNEIDDKIKKRVLCDNPIFDKKKQLCRSLLSFRSNVVVHEGFQQVLYSFGFSSLRPYSGGIFSKPNPSEQPRGLAAGLLRRLIFWGTDDHSAL